MKSAGQYQVVIGNHVPDVFEEVIKVAGIKEGNSVITEEKQSFGNKFLEYVQAIFMPYLAVISAAGIIKGLATIFALVGWVPTDSGLGVVIAGIGDSVFYFLPMFVAYTLSTKIGLNKFVGLAIGASYSNKYCRTIDSIWG